MTKEEFVKTHQYNEYLNDSFIKDLDELLKETVCFFITWYEAGGYLSKAKNNGELYNEFKEQQ